MYINWPINIENLYLAKISTSILYVAFTACSGQAKVLQTRYYSLQTSSLTHLHSEQPKQALQFW